MSVITRCASVLLGLLMLSTVDQSEAVGTTTSRTASGPRERVSLNADWRFRRFVDNPDGLSYETLKPWILPAANDFLSGSKYERPSEVGPGSNVTYVQPAFDDGAWEAVNLPHDWAAGGDFDFSPELDGGTGRLPINGIGWYRRSLALDPSTIESGRSVFLDIDGAMAYATVWLNGQLVGGWPYGYNSFRLDLTPYAQAGDNLLAIRVDNAPDSSRWYPGAGIYRNTWLVIVSPVHVAQYGTYLTTPKISPEQATIDLKVEVENKGNTSQTVQVTTEVFELDALSRRASGSAVAKISAATVSIPGGVKQSVNGSTTVANPKLWGPVPKQTPNEYIAITTLSSNGTAIDVYETLFGIRSITYEADQGVLINGIHVPVYGTCNHHDLGSLGAAFNYRAAERQIEMLQEMGNTALRTSHNPPAPELLDLADRLGLMVMDEIFDTWNVAKVDNDFHLIFPEWHEPDLRSFVRRDRNHPSIISWSIGNEIPEQSESIGTATAKMLQDIVHEEDPTKQVTIGMNSAGPNTGLAAEIDIIGLNYQGEGRGSASSGSFASFRSMFPNKMIWSTESASTVSSRGIYLFPVTPNKSAIVGGKPGEGGDPINSQVSAYELYAPTWASSPDKVFEQHDRNPYVAGEFVWTGFDYIGEPTPYDNSSRSSYFGIIDLAGFKKDRFYLYQARWRPDYPQVHILPHWSWPDREGQVTPVHVFTSGDEAELFINGKSAGRQKRGQYDYRLRWDNVTYTPGEINVKAWKNGQEWATASHRTVGAAASLNVTADRTSIDGDGKDLSFVTVAVVDENGDTVPQADNKITFSVASGPGEIVTTDNGDPRDGTPFPSPTRKAFSGLALAIIRAKQGSSGEIVIKVTSEGLTAGQVVLTAA
ncbi:Beta-galactosidase [Ascochyta rabiei]|uniref:Hydrolase n=1 Tax=Didymella rabiei TaxID=5454 RepID=A0A163H4G4_DIDRA|nr:Beta-galactosidase [Ascochyta rabiei]KZM25152.1 hydrolase [Ascochyta rabiei]UPX18166.1 Beta-galactosidase [Ascochyta rabiei]